MPFQLFRLTHTVVADGKQWLRRHTLADVAHARVQVADMSGIESRSSNRP